MNESFNNKRVKNKLLETMVYTSKEFEEGFSYASEVPEAKHNALLRPIIFANIAKKLTKDYLSNRHYKQIIINFLTENIHFFTNSDINEIQLILNACECRKAIHIEFFLRSIIIESMYNRLIEEVRENL